MVDQHLILVFCEAPSVIGQELGAAKIFDFCNEKKPASGVYFVGQALSSTAWLLPNSGSDFQGDCSRIAALGLPSPTLMVLGRKAGHALLWVGGIEEPTTRVEVSLSTDASLTEARLLHELDRFEQQCWSHEFRKKIWNTSLKVDWVPKERAEQIVQADLYIWLNASFREFNTLAEIDVGIGRADLIMMPKGQRPERAVVELKVAKTLTSGGRTIAAKQEQQRILTGHTQTQAYAIKLGASIRLLCAYDLRAIKEASFFLPIEATCKTENVVFKSYAVYFSSAQAQAALVQAAKTN
jgi:hypothetical protein